MLRLMLMQMRTVIVLLVVVACSLSVKESAVHQIRDDMYQIQGVQVDDSLDAPVQHSSIARRKRQALLRPPQQTIPQFAPRPLPQRQFKSDRPGSRAKLSSGPYDYSSTAPPAQSPSFQVVQASSPRPIRDYFNPAPLPRLPSLPNRVPPPQQLHRSYVDEPAPLPVPKPGKGGTNYYYPPRAPLPLPKCFHNPTGYVCCNEQLNDLIVDTYTQLETKPKFHACNIQLIATHLQLNAQRVFNTSFETLVGYEDFAQKIHFKGDLVCKVELGGRYMIAYGTASERYNKRSKRATDDDWTWGDGVAESWTSIHSTFI